MSIAHVQGGHGQDTTGSAVSSISVTLPGTVGNGNRILGIVAGGASATNVLQSITDDKGNTYTILDNQVHTWNGATALFCTFISQGAITNSPQTLTATFTTAIQFPGIFCDEYSGLSTGANDGHAFAFTDNAGSITSASSGNVTTTQNGDLIYGVASGRNILGSLAAGSGFTKRQDGSANSYSTYTEDFIAQTSAGSIAATWSFTDSNDSIFVALIAVPPASGGSPQSTWDPGFETGITLGGNNFLATGTGTNDGVRSTTSKTSGSGKFYFELTTSGGAGLNWIFGVGNSSWSDAVTPGFDANNSIGFKQDGGVVLNSASIAVAQVFWGSGATIGIALDTVNHKIWITTDGTNWGGSGASANPATNTNGYDITAITGALFAIFWTNTANAAATINFGGSTFSYAVPSGFIGWDNAGVSVAYNESLTPTDSVRYGQIFSDVINEARSPVDDYLPGGFHSDGVSETGLNVTDVYLLWGDFKINPAAQTWTQAGPGTQSWTSAISATNADNFSAAIGPAVPNAGGGITPPPNPPPPPTPPTTPPRRRLHPRLHHPRFSSLLRHGDCIWPLFSTTARREMA